MLQALLILLAVFLIVRLLRHRSADDFTYAETARSGDFTPEDLWDHVEHPYHCVACRCSNGGCKAVQPLEGHYYLVGESHELPVPECTAVPCRCRYVHYADRRHSEEDRRAAFGLERDMYRLTHDRDRRISLGRRIEDWAVEDMEVALPS